MGNELDYLEVLRAVNEIHFNVGRKLLADILSGNTKNDSVQRNRLDKLKCFGSLAYTEEEVNALVDNLLMNSLLELTPIPSNKFIKVLQLTAKGKEELKNPSLYKRKVGYSYKHKETKITEDDKKNFEQLDFFLNSYNDEQKKAIICPAKEILCIAGAGSGKTTVLTKRIEFLVKFKSANPSRILAITFTRKARQEMASRLSEFDQNGNVQVETFNSFCEKILKRNSDLAYGKQVFVINYGEKLRLVRRALVEIGTDINRAIDLYFDTRDKKTKTPEQLESIFMNDCFFIRDYLKFKGKKMDEILAGKENDIVKLVHKVCNKLEEYMQKLGYRDYADQLMDAISLFKKHPELIYQYEHVLIDEYQDVNSVQMELIEILSPKNIFCVGDPRQSIYGWRGSDIKYILGFEEKYPDCEIITLVKNYRSAEKIVKLINKAISNMKLPDLKSARDDPADTRLLNFESENAEFEFVCQTILSSDTERNEIFVLARTNRQLTELSAVMKSRGISHVVRSEEFRSSQEASEEEVTLATVHAIKGLEAKMVFVIGCTSSNFPCKAAEHPVIDMVAIEEYDKEEEERRLLYVAMSRAKAKLYMTHAGKNITPFITDELKEMISGQEKKKTAYDLTKKSMDLLSELKIWRSKTCRKNNVPAYMILADSTLMEIVESKPIDERELEKIKGFGPVKLKKYGEEILEIVNR